MSEVESSVSGRSGNPLSETSSRARANEFLRKRHNHAPTQEEQDLLEQNKTLQEAIFSSMYALVKAKTAESWKLALVKMVLEALVPFLVVFNPTMGWAINTSNPVWQVVRWALPRSPIARIFGYQMYVVVFYAIAAVIYTVLLLIGGLTLAMRKQDHSKWLHRFASILQKVTDLIFSVFYVAIFDFMVFLFSCHFGEPGNRHSYWEDIECLSGDHMIVLAVAGVTSIVFFCATALFLIASCELNPVSPAIMASPAAVTRVRVLTLKATYVIVAATLGSISKVQAILILVPVCGITWFNFATLPFLRFYINDLWTGGWMGVLYTAAIHVAWKFDKRSGHEEEVDRAYVMYVLYGIFPAIAGGAIITTAWSRWRLRVSPKFENLPPQIKLKQVHVFGSPDDVEVVARAMRHFNSDGLVVEDKAVLGETIVKCGLAVFPNDVGLLVLLANFLMEVRRDGPAARTQLQLALKSGPSMIQRYQIFCTIENSKRLKDGQEGTLDLQSYVEFKRNYRAVIRMHKSALAAQRDVWQLMMQPLVKQSALEAALRGMEEAADAAHRVYRRVLERYPRNGKLLRCYGKFLEDVRHDPLAAARAYAGAARNGGGDGLLSLDLQIQGSDKPEFLTSMDLHEDACVVVNAEGKILMVNSCVTSLLGYAKMDLEGANVSMIMPQPFSGRHPGYMSRYVQGGEPHILDTVREVVALHKDRYVFPLRLCVTKLSGVGSDAVFLGLMRPEPLDTRNVRAWLAPNGTILCCDPQFASLTGMTSDEMVGRNVQSLVTDNTALEALLELCRESAFELLQGGSIQRRLEVVHRYLPPIPVEVKVTPGGTDGQRILVLNAHRTDGNTDGLMVVDTRGGLAFATWDVAAMLAYPLRKFLKLKLDQLLPQPFNTMHAKHLRDQPSAVPPTSCRAGALVNMLNSNGTNVPVRLKITTKDDSNGHALHVVQVAKADASSNASMYSDKRVALLCTLDGTILSVDQPGSMVFGFAANAVVGSNLADCIDVFAEWRVKAGAHQLELLLLSLLDKEAEMPGTSWRVKVHPPDLTKPDDRLPDIHAGGAAAANKPQQARHSEMIGISACLQSEIVDITEVNAAEAGAGGGDGAAGGAGGGIFGSERAFGMGKMEGDEAAENQTGAVTSRARIVLWRRDLLSGVVELDEQLVLRKADVSTGLIVGLPPSALPRMPLGRLLELPQAVGNWEDLMNKAQDGAPGGAGKKGRKGALKGGVAGAMVSLPRSFIGSHPDGGSMKVILQGVSGGPCGSRITATMHPDVTYVGARANVYRALGLEALIEKQAHDRTHPHGQQHPQQSAHGQHVAQDGPRADGNVPPPPQTAAGGQHHPVKEGGKEEAKKPGASAPGKPPKPPLLAGKPEQPQEGGAGLGEGAAVKEGDGGEASNRVRAAVSLGARSSRLRFSVADGDSAAGRGGSAASGGGRSLAAATIGVATEAPEGSRSGPGSGRNGSDDDSASSYDSDGEGEELERQKKERESRRRRRRRARAKRKKGEEGKEAAKEKDGGEEQEEEDDEDDDDEEDENEDGDADHLHRNARDQSDFIASWVRALSRNMSSVVERQGTAASETAKDGSGALQGGVASAAALALSRANSHALAHKPTAQQQAGQAGAAGPGADTLQHARASLRSARSRPLSRSASRRGDALGGPSGGAEAEATLDLVDEDFDEETEMEIEKRLKRMETKKAAATEEEKLVPEVAAGTGPAARQGSGLSGGEGNSSAGGDDDDGTSAGGPSISDASSTMDVDLNIDARRTRLLKRLYKLMGGPYIAIPVWRLRVRTLLLLLTMLITHVVCFIVLVDMINAQFDNVRAVHRLALAADRCQVAVVKSAIAEFCSRPGIARESVCEASVEATTADLRTALDDLEAYHQGTYLGVTTTPRRQTNPTLWALWTTPSIDYQVYMDTLVVQWTHLSAGVWQLGNRFVAAGRELLYWARTLDGAIRNHRAFQFVLANGPWSVFRGYTDSLDYLAMEALNQIRQLQKGILILLLVEAVGVQLVCILYEWWLAWSCEVGRRGGLLVGLGLPGPILRVLASRPLIVMEDSDDDDDDNDDEDGEGGGGGDKVVERGGGSAKGEGGGGGLGGLGGRNASAISTDDESDEEPFGRGGAAHKPHGNKVSPAPAAGPGGHHKGHADTERAAPVSELVPGVGGVAGSEAGSVPGGGVVVGKKGAVVKKVSNGVKVNNKVLAPSPNNLLKFVIPLALWEAALIVVVAVSYTQLERIQEPLVILNMASHVIYRYTRVRMIALLLVTGINAEDRAQWREVLKEEVGNLESEYDTLMYGGVARTQVGTVFEYPVPASTFASNTFAADFFKSERCFRWDQSKCYTHDSPYYEVTHHGLDVMMRRILSEMTLLVADDDADATYNGTRYTTMYMVGIRDLYEGVQSSAQLFMDYMLGRYDSVKLIHTVLLVATIALLGGYALLVLRPYLSATEALVGRLAGLLSHVPAEMDVVNHARLVLRGHSKLVGGAGTGVLGGVTGFWGGGVKGRAKDGGAGGDEDERARRRPRSGLRRSMRSGNSGLSSATGGSEAGPVVVSGRV